uniref:N-acetyltransferase domain-containing protein n=1 Tax=Monodelphis domestica TaxID=13616 RepID=A0A5F8H029_MONDO
MAPYHIRKYQDQDRETVIDIFTKGILYHVPASFFHLLKQPRSFLLLFGVSGAMFLGSGSCILSLLAFLGLLIILWWIVRYPYSDYVDHALHTDMRDIRKSYLSDKGSCFWVAETDNCCDLSSGKKSRIMLPRPGSGVYRRVCQQMRSVRDTTLGSKLLDSAKKCIKSN